MGPLPPPAAPTTMGGRRKCQKEGDSGEEALPPLLLGSGQPFGYTRFFPTLPYLLYQDHPDMNPVPCSASGTPDAADL